MPSEQRTSTPRPLRRRYRTRRAESLVVRATVCTTVGSTVAGFGITATLGFGGWWWLDWWILAITLVLASVVVLCLNRASALEQAAEDRELEASASPLPLARQRSAQPTHTRVGNSA